MFLTRMALNPARRGTRWLTESPHRMHAAVLSGFSPTQETSGAGGRVLWRVDRMSPRGLTLFVSSPDRPDLSHIVEQAGWPTTGEAWETGDMSSLLDSLATGQRWMFRLTANPVASRRRQGERSRIQGRRSVDDQTEWLVERSAKQGFVVPTNTHGELELSLGDRNVPSFDRRGESRRDRVTLVTARYDGVLEVVDPDLLRRALCHGIGRAKGYGCGMLTLARP